MKYKYLITGGAGFIGSEIANILGSECIVIDNLSTGKRQNLNKNIKLITGDIRDADFLDKVFKKYNPERVIHLAAQINASKSVTDPVTDAEINIIGSINILQTAVKYKCKKIVLASSAAVYGDNKNLPLKEDEDLDPLSPYGISKMTMETYAKYFYRTHGLKYTILRFANVYGSRQSGEAEGGAVAVFMNNLKTNKDITVFGDGEQTRDFIYVKDIAAATITVIKSNKTGTYNVSTNKIISINDLINLMKKTFASSSKVRYVKPRKGDIKHSRLDNKAIARELKWKPLFSVSSGLSDMLKNL